MLNVKLEEIKSAFSIQYFKTLPSTHLYLLDQVKSNQNLKLPIAILADTQTKGIGSRGNKWIGSEGDLFLSFAMKLNSLPNDLKVESSSIYFAMLLKLLLKDLGSKVWVKWPNDLYIGDKKLGGFICSKVGDSLICSVGVNLKSSLKEFAVLDIGIDSKTLCQRFLKTIEKNIKWKNIFKKFQIEFKLNKNYYFNLNGSTISFKNVHLNEDGSCNLDGQNIYSSRSRGAHV